MATRVYNDEGRYLRHAVELEFSFVLPATPTDAPTVIRDGQGALVASVSAISTGVQTITFKTHEQSPGIVLPQEIVSWSVEIAKAATGDHMTAPNLVAGSYDLATRTVDIVYRDSDDGAVGTTDLAAGDVVCIKLKGTSLEQFTESA